MKTLALALLVLAAALGPPLALAQASDSDDEHAARACLVPADAPAFADFERLRPLWAAHYEARRTEFRSQLLENQSAISRCAEKALRRDLTRNSRTSFGVLLAADGRVDKLALLAANHADTLYAACLARTLCSFQLAPPAQQAGEVLLFNFNLNRKRRPHERPWDIEGHGPRH